MIVAKMFYCSHVESVTQRSGTEKDWISLSAALHALELMRPGAQLMVRHVKTDTRFARVKRLSVGRWECQTARGIATGDRTVVESAIDVIVQVLENYGARK